MKQYPPRPRITEAMKDEAATGLVAKLGWNPGRAKDIANSYYPGCDGFELAKELDRRHGWDTTRDEMEELDGMDERVQELLSRATREWFELNAIEPPFEIGQRVECHGAFGHITGIAEHYVACFEVKPEGQDDAATGSRRYIIKFEEVVPA